MGCLMFVTCAEEKVKINMVRKRKSEKVNTEGESEMDERGNRAEFDSRKRRNNKATLRSLHG